MTVLIAFLSALLILFGVLALPYNTILALVSWLLSVGALVAGTLRLNAARTPLLLATALFVLLGVLGWTLLLMPWANREVASDLRALNPDGTAGRALVVYHPGRSDLQEQAVAGFADGLVARGWQVDLSTASDQAPGDLAGYDLLVLGAQSYTWAPAQPVQRYLRRVGDLRGLPVVAIISGLGETGPANRVMQGLVGAANGELVGIYNLWQLRPIDEEYGTSDPTEAMHGVAEGLQLP